jgi:hypothetical protein
MGPNALLLFQLEETIADRNEKPNLANKGSVNQMAE